MTFKNRIKELRYVPAGSIIANPKNWRKHPKSQSEALKGILGEIGFAGAVLARETPDGLMLIDGHLRKESVLPNQQVPVLVLDVTEAEADKILATFDPLAAMATTDAEALETLLKDIQTQSGSVAKMMAELKESTRTSELATIEEEEEELAETIQSSGIYEYTEAAIFSSSNEWGIPDLREDMLCDLIPDRIWDGIATEDNTKTMYNHASGRMTHENCKGGLLTFYCDDYKFDNAWDDAVKFLAKLISLEWGGVVVPDFSTYENMPRVIRYFNLYKARWVARYWQEAGVKVMPNINFGAKGDDMSLCYAGIPKGVHSVACQVRTTGKFRKTFVQGVSLSLIALQPKHVILYGGDDNRKWLEGMLPEGPEYHWLSSYTRVRMRGR